MYRGYMCLYRKIWSNSILAEPGKRFSKFEAWLYIIHVLATGVDNTSAGLKRGEFKASIRKLAECFNWSVSTVHAFLEILLQNSMIVRVEHASERETGHFIVCNYALYNSPRNASPNAEPNTIKESIKENIKENKNKERKTHTPPADGARVPPDILLQMYQQHNRSLPEVKAFTPERHRKCQSRINQAVRDGCLEQYLADFLAAVQKAQQTPFLRGEGARGWRASFDWLVSNQVNLYAVLEGKYDGPPAGPNYGGGHDNARFYSGGDWPADGHGRESSGKPRRRELPYVPRQ